MGKNPFDYAGKQLARLAGAGAGVAFGMKSAWDACYVPPGIPIPSRKPTSTPDPEGAEYKQIQWIPMRKPTGWYSRTTSFAV
jgi:hypothetical protein